MPHQSPQSPRSRGPYINDESDDVNPRGETIVPLKPVPEGYDGHLFPYRGVQTHGVNPNLVDEPPEEMQEGGYVTVKPSKKDDAPPIPVYIVEPGTKEYKQWRTGQTFANPGATLLVNRKENRETLTIQNMSPDKNVFVGPDSNVSTVTGYLLKAGATFTLNGEAEVWGMTTDVNPVQLCVFFEFSTSQPK